MLYNWKFKGRKLNITVKTPHVLFMQNGDVCLHALWFITRSQSCRRCIGL